MIKTLKNQENIDYTHAVEIAPKNVLGWCLFGK
jgi:hypothetical protein